MMSIEEIIAARYTAAFSRLVREMHPGAGDGTARRNLAEFDKWYEDRDE